MSEFEVEVNDFIKRRWSSTNAHWLDGNCYWFAQILITRFPCLRLYYLPIEGHFVAGCSNHYYDIRGSIKLNESPILYSKIVAEDPLWAQRIRRDCIE